MNIRDYMPSRIQARLIRALVLARSRLIQAMERDGGVTKETVDAYRASVRDFLLMARQQSQLAGWLSPWFPMLYEDEALLRSGEAPKPIPDWTGQILHSLDAEEPLRWDQQDAAKNFLDQEITDFPARWANLLSREQIAAETSAASVSQSMIDRLNKELRESIAAGESRDTWRARAQKIIDLPDHSYERVARTATHRSFQQGKAAVLATPGVRSIFPYRKYLPTMDNRVRPEHAEMNRWIYHKDSALAARAARQLADWNCRCSEIPMTEADALRGGVHPDGHPDTDDGDVIDRAFAAHAADESYALTRDSGGFDRERSLMNLQDRIQSIDPFRIREEATVTNPLTVEAVQPLGRDRFAIQTREQPGLIELEGEAPEPGDAVAFDLASEQERQDQPDRLAAIRTIKKVSTVTILGQDENGQYRVLVESGSNLPTVDVRPDETPQDAASRILGRYGLAGGSLQASGKFNAPYRNPELENEWSYSFVSQVRGRLSDGENHQWIPIKEATGLGWAQDFGLQFAEAIRSLVRFAVG